MRVEPSAPVARRDRGYYEARREAKARSARRRRRLALAAAAALVVAAVATSLAFAGSSERIAAGVSIAGVDVGGLSAAEAKELLAERVARSASQPALFTFGEKRFSIAPAKLGVTGDWDKAIDDALEAGDGFVLFRGFTRLKLRLAGTDVTPGGRGDAAAVEREVERLARAIDTEPREASIVLRDLEPSIVAGRAGVTLDRDSAAALLVATLAGLDRNGSVPLPVRVEQPAVRAADLTAVLARVRTALSHPVRLEYRRTDLTIGPKRLATLLKLPHDGSRELTIGGDGANRYFAGVVKAFDREPRDASFRLTAQGKIRVVGSREGRILDVPATAKALLAAALKTAPAARSASLVVATAQPERTTAEAKAMGVVGVVGSYTTSYGGDPNRIHNVELVSTLIDDTLIPPGATFSFNQTTGERNADKGFLEAPVIVNGELENALGGGVCQVSTTVFNAAYEAGLPVIERTNHALYISHYPLGRDATVNYPDTDLKFTNDTEHWLWLRAFVSASSLTINLYGTPVDRKVVTETSPLEITGRREVERILDPTLYVGERVVEETGEPARSVSVRRIVYDAEGNVLYDAVWYSNYVSEPRIVRVGTKPKPVEEKPPAAQGKDESSQDGTQGGADQNGTQGPVTGGGAKPGAGEETPGSGAEPPPTPPS